ncbi:MAG: DUF192 domain-containing protein [Synechococcaceae cyanobacterium SM2_3_1]|nr:DUF192 domain-containing protein [Synechococcaceae cyanobacterium SM2_3_1]
MNLSPLNPTRPPAFLPGHKSLILPLAALLVLGSPQVTNAETRIDKMQPQNMNIEAQAVIGDRTFDLEVAKTPQQQSLGLMFREQLPEDRGMLFPMDPPRPATFWMYNTYIALDIIFMLDGKIVHLADNVPSCLEQPCPTYGPPRDQLVDQVLEFRGGTAQELGLEEGDTIQVTEIK